MRRTAQEMISFLATVSADSMANLVVPTFYAASPSVDVSHSGFLPRDDYPVQELDKGHCGSDLKYIPEQHGSCSSDALRSSSTALSS